MQQQGHPSILARPESQIPTETQEFWDRGFARPAVRFKDQVELAERPEDDPSLRQNIITAKPIAITNSQYGSRSRLFFTESEGLADLSQFIETVSQQAAADKAGSDSYDESQKMLEYSRDLREELVYMRKQDYDVACFGVATAWQAYVMQSPDHVINIFAPNRSGRESYNKSYEVVLQDILHAFHRLTQADLQAIARLKIGPESWCDTDAAKLVVVDDWAISGHTIESNMQQARNAARSAGMEGLADKAEAHLLVARGDHLFKGVELPSGDEEDKKQSFPVRGYFAAGPIAEESRGVPISGSHSSVDYHFEGPLSWMREYLESKKIYREAPLLTEIQRRYQEEKQMYDPQAVTILARLAGLNKLYDDLRTKEVVLRCATSATTANQEDLDALYDALDTLQDARKELNATADEYRAYANANLR